MSEEVLWVFVAGLVTALATGLGAVPFAVVPTVSERMTAVAGAIASGLMLGASLGLVVEGTDTGVWQTLIGAGLGIGFILLVERFLAGQGEVDFGELKGQSAREILLVLVAMTAHSFAEGVAIGVSFGGEQQLAFVITVAIAIHNIPEGLAISAVMRPRGSSVTSCAVWSIFSSLPQPLMAVPAFLFVDQFIVILPYGLGFAAGAMAFMVFWELLPAAYRGASKTEVGLTVSLTLAAMILFQRLLG